MKELNARNKTLWIGIAEHPFLWIDIGNIFSLDFGKYFIRVFFEIKRYNFCRYLGIIRC